ncbi:dockerin type I domain-containing protein [Candidatus Omnitrophota bacterium]
MLEEILERVDDGRFLTQGDYDRYDFNDDTFIDTDDETDLANTFAWYRDVDGKPGVNGDDVEAIEQLLRLKASGMDGAVVEAADLTGDGRVTAADKKLVDDALTVFEMADSDSDGAVTAAELKFVYETIGDFANGYIPDKHEIELADITGEGWLNTRDEDLLLDRIDELEKDIADIEAWIEQAPLLFDEILEEAIDVDGDGRITTEEVSDAVLTDAERMRQIIEEYTEKKAEHDITRELIEAADYNKDGWVNASDKGLMNMHFEEYYVTLLDMDEDGLITELDRKATREVREELTSINIPSFERFQQFDFNSDGSVDRGDADEIWQVMRGYIDIDGDFIYNDSNTADGATDLSLLGDLVAMTGHIRQMNSLTDEGDPLSVIQVLFSDELQANKGSGINRFLEADFDESEFIDSGDVAIFMESFEVRDNSYYDIDENGVFDMQDVLLITNIAESIAEFAIYELASMRDDSITPIGYTVLNPIEYDIRDVNNDMVIDETDHAIVQQARLDMMSFRDDGLIRFVDSVMIQKYKDLNISITQDDIERGNFTQLNDISGTEPLIGELTGYQGGFPENIFSGMGARYVRYPKGDEDVIHDIYIRAKNLPPDEKGYLNLYREVKTIVPDADVRTKDADLNGDGLVNAADTFLVQRAMRELRIGENLKVYEEGLSDIDSDGRITIKDMGILEEVIGYATDVNRDGYIDDKDTTGLYDIWERIILAKEVRAKIEAADEIAGGSRDRFGPYRGRISALTSHSSGAKTMVTSAAHGLQEGDEVVISGTDDYNDTYTIESCTDDTFVIAKAHVTDETDGRWVSERPYPYGSTYDLDDISKQNDDPEDRDTARDYISGLNALVEYLGFNTGDDNVEGGYRQMLKMIVDAIEQKVFDHPNVSSDEGKKVGLLESFVEEFAIEVEKRPEYSGLTRIDTDVLKDELEALFSKAELDLDHNGEVEREEALEVLRGIFRFDELDRDEDGSVDQDEMDEMKRMLRTVLQASSIPSDELERSDVSGDGIINGFDYELLYKAVTSNINIFGDERIDIMDYRAWLMLNDYFKFKVRQPEDIDGDGELDPGEDLNGNGVLDWKFDELLRADFNEDANGNGLMDPGEDFNKNGILDGVDDAVADESMIRAGQRIPPLSDTANEYFYDENWNGRYDEGEVFWDHDPDGPGGPQKPNGIFDGYRGSGEIGAGAGYSFSEYPVSAAPELWGDWINWSKVREAVETPSNLKILDYDGNGTFTESDAEAIADLIDFIARGTTVQDLALVRAADLATDADLTQVATGGFLLLGQDGVVNARDIAQFDKIYGMRGTLDVDGSGYINETRDPDRVDEVAEFKRLELKFDKWNQQFISTPDSDYRIITEDITMRTRIITAGERKFTVSLNTFENTYIFKPFYVSEADAPATPEPDYYSDPVTGTVVLPDADGGGIEYSISIADNMGRIVLRRSDGSMFWEESGLMAYMETADIGLKGRGVIDFFDEDVLFTAMKTAKELGIEGAIDQEFVDTVGEIAQLVNAWQLVLEKVTWEQETRYDQVLDTKNLRIGVVIEDWESEHFSFYDLADESKFYSNVDASNTEKDRLTVKIGSVWYKIIPSTESFDITLERLYIESEKVALGTVSVTTNDLTDKEYYIMKSGTQADGYSYEFRASDGTETRTSQMIGADYFIYIGGMLWNVMEDTFTGVISLEKQRSMLSENESITMDGMEIVILEGSDTVSRAYTVKFEDDQVIISDQIDEYRSLKNSNLVTVDGRMYQFGYQADPLSFTFTEQFSGDINSDGVVDTADESLLNTELARSLADRSATKLNAARDAVSFIEIDGTEYDVIVAPDGSVSLEQRVDKTETLNTLKVGGRNYMVSYERIEDAGNNDIEKDVLRFTEYTVNDAGKNIVIGSVTDVDYGQAQVTLEDISNAQVTYNIAISDSWDIELTGPEQSVATDDILLELGITPMKNGKLVSSTWDSGENEVTIRGVTYDVEKADGRFKFIFAHEPADYDLLLARAGFSYNDPGWDEALAHLKRSFGEEGYIISDRYANTVTINNVAYSIEEINTVYSPEGAIQSGEVRLSGRVYTFDDSLKPDMFSKDPYNVVVKDDPTAQISTFYIDGVAYEQEVDSSGNLSIAVELTLTPGEGAIRYNIDAVRETGTNKLLEIRLTEAGESSQAVTSIIELGGVNYGWSFDGTDYTFTDGVREYVSDGMKVRIGEYIPVNVDPDEMTDEEIAAVKGTLYDISVDEYDDITLSKHKEETFSAQIARIADRAYALTPEEDGSLLMASYPDGIVDGAIELGDSSMEIDGVDHDIALRLDGTLYTIKRSADVQGDLIVETYVPGQAPVYVTTIQEGDADVTIGTNTYEVISLFKEGVVVLRDPLTGDSSNEAQILKVGPMGGRVYTVTETQNNDHPYSFLFMGMSEESYIDADDGFDKVELDGVTYKITRELGTGIIRLTEDRLDEDTRLGRFISITGSNVVYEVDTGDQDLIKLAYEGRVIDIQKDAENADIALFMIDEFDINEDPNTMEWQPYSFQLGGETREVYVDPDDVYLGDTAKKVDIDGKIYYVNDTEAADGLLYLEREYKVIYSGGQDTLSLVDEALQEIDPNYDLHAGFVNTITIEGTPYAVKSVTDNFGGQIFEFTWTNTVDGHTEYDQTAANDGGVQEIVLSLNGKRYEVTDNGDGTVHITQSDFLTSEDMSIFGTERTEVAHIVDMGGMEYVLDYNTVYEYDDNAGKEIYKPRFTMTKDGKVFENRHVPCDVGVPISDEDTEYFSFEQNRFIIDLPEVSIGVEGYPDEVYASALEIYNTETGESKLFYLKENMHSPGTSYTYDFYSEGEFYSTYIKDTGTDWYTYTIGSTTYDPGWFWSQSGTKNVTLAWEYEDIDGNTKVDTLDLSLGTVETGGSDLNRSYVDAMSRYLESHTFDVSIDRMSYANGDLEDFGDQPGDVQSKYQIKHLQRVQLATRSARRVKFNTIEDNWQDDVETFDGMDVFQKVEIARANYDIIPTSTGIKLIEEHIESEDTSTGGANSLMLGKMMEDGTVDVNGAFGMSYGTEADGTVVFSDGFNTFRSDLLTNTVEVYGGTYNIVAEPGTIGRVRLVERHSYSIEKASIVRLNDLDTNATDGEWDLTEFAEAQALHYIQKGAEFEDIAGLGDDGIDAGEFAAAKAAGLIASKRIVMVYPEKMAEEYAIEEKADGTYKIFKAGDLAGESAKQAKLGAVYYDRRRGQRQGVLQRGSAG